MTDPRQIAASVVGAVDWQSEVSGFCRCPGESLHTHKTGKKDCRVSVDGAPTIYCFHASCAPAVAAANLRLRRELGSGGWEIALPGGRVLRSGDILQGDGTVRTREEIQSGNIQHATFNSQHPMGAGGTHCATTEEERMVLATIRALAERFKADLFHSHPATRALVKTGTD